QQRFISEATALLDSRRAFLPETARLIICYGGIKNVEIQFDGVDMLEKIMWSRLGNVLIRIIKGVCGTSGCQTENEWDVEMGVFMAEFYLRLFPQEQRNRGIETRVRWLGERGEEPWRVNPGPWDGRRDLEGVEWGRGIDLMARGLGGWTRIESESERGWFEDRMGELLGRRVRYTSEMGWEAGKAGREDGKSKQSVDPGQGREEVRPEREKRVRFQLPTVTEDEEEVDEVVKMEKTPEVPKVRQPVREEDKLRF
ncbi:hypothetical protein QBC38DRAFT_517140, partial [Podospora fimiseda]